MKGSADGFVIARLKDAREFHMRNSESLSNKATSQYEVTLEVKESMGPGQPAINSTHVAKIYDIVNSM